MKEHPDIFARWDREAAAYRDDRRKVGAEFAIPYGQSERQKYDFFPAGGESTPLAMFIHGGWWRSHERERFSWTARGLNAHGIAVAVPSYDLCPHVSIATIIDEMRQVTLALWRTYKKRITVYGHSAGGHLASCMAATQWTSVAPDAPSDLVPAAYAISGIFDLAPLLHISQNVDLKLDVKSARDCSPIAWKIPAGPVLDAVVGGDESSEFLRQSQTMAQAWKQVMAEARYEIVLGTNHFSVLDPLSDAKSAMVKRLAELARRGHAL